MDSNGKDQIKITITFSEVNYSSVIKAYLPYFISELSKINTIAHTVETLNSSTENLVQASSAFLDVLPQKTRDETMVSLINDFSDRLISFLFLPYLLKNNIKIKIEQFTAELNNSIIEISIFFSDIDYSSIVDLLIPYYSNTRLMEIESPATDSSRFDKLKKSFTSKLFENKDLVKTMTKSALLLLPQRSLDLLSVSAINANSQRILDSIMSFIQDKGIELTHKSLTAYHIDLNESIHGNI